MVMFTFQVFDPKYVFRANLIAKLDFFVSIVRFDTSTNWNNSMILFVFSILGWKCLSWANLVQKIKIIILGWNLVLRLIRKSKFNGDVHFL